MPMTCSPPNRVLHLTLEKCGSQWVRDVLNAPEVQAYSRRPYSGVTLSMADCRTLEIPDFTFSGPIYGMNQWEWEYWRNPDDRAVVVLRDPRDALISLLYSLLYSHVPTSMVDAFRKTLHGLENQEARISYLITSQRRSISFRMYKSWVTQETDSALLIRYESLIQDQQSGFRKILDWLHWPVPDDTLGKVVERLSFSSRSGRQPGEGDKLSHFRKGIANDWRNHFTQEHGELWEQLYPGLLTEIGYEQSNDWWLALPKTQRELADETDSDQIELIQALEQKLRNQQAELIAKEKVIQGLITERIANRYEVPADSPTLREQQMSAEMALLYQACDERLQLINHLHDEAAALQQQLTQLQSELRADRNSASDLHHEHSALPEKANNTEER